MKHSADSLILGVDGGGSGCRARLVDGAGTVLSEARGAAANVWTDFENATAALQILCKTVIDAGDINPAANTDIAAHFGLAGVLNKDVALKVANAMPFENTTVSDDRATSLIGALGGSDGIVIAIGTGSFVAQKSCGQTRFLGGWGYHSGDQASGAWLGHELLVDALMCHDGILPTSPLFEQVLTAHGGADGIAGFARNATPSDFATLAPLIADAADDGDQSARTIMARGTEYILASISALDLKPSEVICPLGGLGARYVPYLPDVLHSKIKAPAGNALDGAVAMAREQLGAVA